MLHRIRGRDEHDAALETNILETTYRTQTGVAALTDPPTTSRTEGPDGDVQNRLVRLLRCEEGHVEGRFQVRPTFDYARVSSHTQAHRRTAKTA